MRRGGRGFHQGPGTTVPTPEAGYKGATEPACPHHLPLAKAGQPAGRPGWPRSQEAGGRAARGGGRRTGPGRLTPQYASHVSRGRAVDPPRAGRGHPGWGCWSPARRFLSESPSQSCPSGSSGSVPGHGAVVCRPPFPPFERRRCAWRPARARSAPAGRRGGAGSFSYQMIGTSARRVW